ncbi:MAG: hypothetical protein Hals2KO_14750 [Halioglobus sp.]
MDFWQQATETEVLRKTQAQWTERWTDAIKNQIKVGQKANVLRPDLNVAQEAELIAIYLDGLGLRASLTPEAWPPAKQKKFLKAFIARLK